MAEANDDQQLTTVTGQSVTNADRGVKVNTFTTECDALVTGMMSYHNHLLIIHDHGDSLFVYDTSGKLKRSVEIRNGECKMNTPNGMCVVWSETKIPFLVIGDYYSNCLWWMAIEKMTDDIQFDHPQTHYVDYYPCGISTDRFGQVMVNDHDNRCLYVYGYPGDHITCLQLEEVYPSQALTDQSDGYVTRCGRTNELSWVDSAGQLTHRYTDQPDINSYHMIANFTDLLVSDRHNHCVHIVTMKGRHDGHLITDIDPTCVCLDPDHHRLWVAYVGKDKMTHVMEMSYTPTSWKSMKKEKVKSRSGKSRKIKI